MIVHFVDHHCLFLPVLILISGREIDALARQPLWKVGLQYLHGTGHGIGSYLNVHEGNVSAIN